MTVAYLEAGVTSTHLKKPAPPTFDERTTTALTNTLIPLERQITNQRQYKTWKRRLLIIARHTNLFDTKQVTAFIQTLKKKDKTPISKGYQRNFYVIYQRFCKDNQIPFDTPKLKVTYPIPLIPSTTNVNKLIDNASKRYATLFKILAETAVEGQELTNTHRNSIDPEQGTISITGCKGHANGVYKLKTQTAEMLRQYLAKNQEAHPFPTAHAMQETWVRHRNRIAKKLCEPELRKIPLKSLRNYAGAIFYNTKGKDPIATQRFMRHLKLETTQHYLQGIMLYEQEEEYTTKTVQLGTPTTVKEITELSDTGYQYYTEADGYKIFRKHK